MRHEVQKLLFNIRQACVLLAQFTADKSFADYSSDDLLRSAVERQFGIVSRSMSQMLKLDPSLALVITDSSQIVSFCDALIHGGMRIPIEDGWQILKLPLPILEEEWRFLITHLPTLQAEVERLLSQEPP